MAVDPVETLKWYVLHAYSGQEAQVVKSLEKRINLKGLQDSFGEIIIPTEEVVEMKAGKKKKSERKFFPGYVLIQMKMNDDTWHLVRSTPRVLGFIGGTSSSPVAITDVEAANIMRRVDDKDSMAPRPKVIYEPGEVIKVIDGPFADFGGVVEQVNYDKSRLKVAVSIFGRSTTVELEFGQVDKE